MSLPFTPRRGMVIKVSDYPTPKYVIEKMFSADDEGRDYVMSFTCSNTNTHVHIVIKDDETTELYHGEKFIGSDVAVLDNGVRIF